MTHHPYERLRSALRRAGGRAGAPAERPLTRAEYDCLVLHGCFDAERLELLEGRMIAMTPQSAAHANAAALLARMLDRQLLGDVALVRTQMPLALSALSEPEPDIAVVAFGDYAMEHPSTALLVVEVALSSLALDRDKGKLYAAAQIPEYWIVDVLNRSIEVYRDPRDDHYQSSFTVASGTLTTTLSPAVTVHVDVAALF